MSSHRDKEEDELLRRILAVLERIEHKLPRINRIHGQDSEAEVSSCACAPRAAAARIEADLLSLR